MTEELDVKIVPADRSYYNLNPDGTYQSTQPWKADVYIEESQSPKIWDPEIVKFIRKNYGPRVCVMHRSKVNTRLPVYATQKFILGG